MLISIKSTLFAKSIQRLLTLTVCLVVCAVFNAKAQKYTFTHYDISDGLIQSQVNTISQDAQHRLWMGTLGGACRFDGNEFKAFSKESGLLNTFVYTILCDHKNRIWFGTHQGLACYTNKRIVNYANPANVTLTWVTNLVEDGAGNIWLIIQGKLFKVNGQVLQYVPVDGTVGNGVTNITVNQAGNLCATVYQKGIYRLNGNTWANMAALDSKDPEFVVRHVLFDKLDSSKIYFIAKNQVYVNTGGKTALYPNADLNKLKANLTCIGQDARGDLWIGSANGAYRIKNQQLIHFTSQNGFSDALVDDIYCDHDGNLWLGTWGDGIYKYEGNTYIVYDQSQGVNSAQTIMGLTRDKQNNIWLAADGSGVMKYDGKVFKPVELPTTNPAAKRAQCIYTDHNYNLWIGSSLGGLWKYDGAQFTMVPKSDMRIANALAEDDSGTMWMAAPLGVFYCSNNALHPIEGINTFTTSLLSIGKDSMLVGTQDGARLVVNKKLVPGFKLSMLKSSNVLCMLRYGNKVLFGTGDWGLVTWDMKSRTTKNYVMQDGFNSNSIYNLIADKTGTIWAGTGRGVNRIIPTADGNNFTIAGSGNSRDIIAEANQNSILYWDDKIWMGTTKGLVIYNAAKARMRTSNPFMVIQSVKLFTSDHVKSMADTVNALIPYKQNHLAISFLGVYLKNPADVSYQYMLVGHDDKFCTPVKNTMVDYPSLPPGKYTFMVKAITSAGLQSNNVAQFSFEIIPPFYKTWIFTGLVLISLVLLGISMQTYMHKRKLRAVRLREQIKREEKQKIRQQTAEDFHDDLGNKLTRITVLSDILSAKLDKREDEQRKLVGQIKQNAESLYNGTKDILWALDPKSDNLYEILFHIREFGIGFFHDTPIRLNFDDIDSSLSKIKLPLEYCRNMTMIYKELLNNILKHSGASQVNFAIGEVKNQEMVILLTDNGKGFNTSEATTGHGITNIKNRAARIDGEITIQSRVNAGTMVTLKLKLKKSDTR